MLVSWAMATFGTVVPGVGTFHAPFSAWGAAATLQKLGALGGAYYGGAALVGTALYLRATGRT